MYTAYYVMCFRACHSYVCSGILQCRAIVRLFVCNARALRCSRKEWESDLASLFVLWAPARLASLLCVRPVHCKHATILAFTSSCCVSRFLALQPRPACCSPPL